jgi:hypothetical protein
VSSWDSTTRLYDAVQNIPRITYNFDASCLWSASTHHAYLFNNTIIIFLCFFNFHFLGGKAAALMKLVMWVLLEA